MASHLQIKLSVSWNITCVTHPSTYNCSPTNHSSDRPNLEYASHICRPHQVNLINILEAVQSCATRFIHSSYSHEISIPFLKAESGVLGLFCRRLTATHCLFHKIVYSLPSHAPCITPTAWISRRLVIHHKLLIRASALLPSHPFIPKYLQTATAFPTTSLPSPAYELSWNM